MPNLRIAPSWGSAIARSLWVLAACSVIGIAVGVINGAPEAARSIANKEGPPYGITWGIGLLQLVGQGALLAAGVYLGRRWLRLKL
jgi:hypothetical protein